MKLNDLLILIQIKSSKITDMLILVSTSYYVSILLKSE